jgi:hypothetical protein
VECCLDLLPLAGCGACAAEGSRERRSWSERRANLGTGNHVPPPVAALPADRRWHRHRAPREVPCGAGMCASQRRDVPAPAGGTCEKASAHRVLRRDRAPVSARPAPGQGDRGKGLEWAAGCAREAAVALTRRPADCRERHRQGHPDEPGDHERKHGSQAIGRSRGPASVGRHIASQSNYAIAGGTRIERASPIPIDRPTQIRSGIISIAPHGHSCTQIPQPLQ